jgi:hypothetical protein
MPCGATCKKGSFSYCNLVVLEEDGRVVACLIGYSLPDVPEPIDHGRTPAMFVSQRALGTCPEASGIHQFRTQRRMSP